MSEKDSFVGAQSPVTADDRAMLLPPPVASSSSEADVDVKTKASIVSSNRDVYTITDTSLPSHMRSLLPSHDQQVHDLLTLERTRKRLRYVIVCLTVLLGLTVVVAVTLVFSLKVTSFEDRLSVSGGRRSPSFPLSDGQMTRMATEVQVSLLDKSEHHPHQLAHYRHTGYQDRRTPCVTECWSYAAFRFRSDCQDGYCRCHGDNYDTYTCLPKYHNCNIEKRLPSKSSAKLFGTNQTTYVCQTPSTNGTDEVHVISIFGNHRTATTHVTIKDQSASKKTLVLVNYHYVKWTLHLPKDSGIHKVVVMSMKGGNQAKRVIFLGEPQEQEIQVSRRLSLTGYGEDKHGGHTPQLLHFIEDNVGPITSFVGTSHADEIFLHRDGSKLAATSTPTSEITPK